MSIGFRLRPKVTIGILVIFLCCMVVSGAIFLSSERSRLQAEIQEQGKALAHLVAEFCAVPIKKYSLFIVEEVARNVEKSEGVAYCEIYDVSGESLVQVDATVHGQALTKKKKDTSQDILIVEKDILFEEDKIGTVEIGLFLEPVKKQLFAYTIRLAIAILATMVVLAICISVFLSYLFISPVIHLSESVKNLGKGTFVETKITRRDDEIGDLARAFNIMSGNLKQLYQSLEKKVDERTAQLAATNEQLQLEIQVRTKVEKDLKVAKESAEKATQYKSNFIANMSHEIRTPLNAILGYAQILMNREDVDGQTHKALEAIDRGGSHLLDLINDILDLSKIEAGRMELKQTDFDLNLLIRNVASMFRLRCQEKNLDWQVVGLDTERVVPVTADAGKLRQILINLLANAVKFTDQGGVILRVEPNQQDNYRFCIEDTGVGVPKEIRDRIFTPFSDISGAEGKEGTGLGLSISNKFLEMMGSSLEVIENSPRGSCFCFNLTLPFASEAVLAEQARTRKITGLDSEKPVRAMIVDDDRLSCSMLSLLLNKIDVATIEAGNGIEALDLLETERPDIIFMDRYMPEMDGITTIKEIRQRFKEETPPIVMITAAAFETENSSTEELNVAAILIKPCDIIQVLECMASVLGLPLKMDHDGKANRSEDKPETLDLANVVLTAEVHARLTMAAEYGKISELKNLVAELENQSEIDQEFIMMIQAHLDAYELAELIELMHKVRVV